MRPSGQLEPGGRKSCPEQRPTGRNQHQVGDLKGEKSNVDNTVPCPEQRPDGSTQHQVGDLKGEKSNVDNTIPCSEQRPDGSTPQLVDHHTVSTTSKVMAPAGWSAC
jgi:hypothetical protein